MGKGKSLHEWGDPLVGDRWKREGGYAEVLRIAIPLILSTGSWSIQHFVDRVFLTWYSREALAAALPAGILNFTVASFFLGTASYANTFVAQYSGAKRPDRVGPAVWQGIHFGLVAGVFMFALIPFAEVFFAWAGHGREIQRLEAAYFRIGCLGGPAIAGAAASAFFSGQGKTVTVMWVNFAATGLNILLDYALIFGNWGFPEMGIRGAAWATVVARYTTTFLFTGLMLRSDHRKRYNTLSGWRPEGVLFRRLVRFGVPNGVQFMLDIMAFSMFVMLVGRLGAVALAATNVAFNINVLAFLPIIGVGVAVSTLVGRYLGQDRPQLAERSTWSAFHLVLLYTGTMAVGYFTVPGLFLNPYSTCADPAMFLPIRETAAVLLKFVAVYCVFDGMYIVFSAAIKGAGDMRFVMWTSTSLAWSMMVVPTYLACVVYQWGLFLPWVFLSAYIMVASTVFLCRFRGGKWKSMRVIEGTADSSTIPARDDSEEGAVQAGGAGGQIP